VTWCSVFNILLLLLLLSLSLSLSLSNYYHRLSNDVIFSPVNCVGYTLYQSLHKIYSLHTDCVTLWTSFKIWWTWWQYPSISSNHLFVSHCIEFEGRNKMLITLENKLLIAGLICYVCLSWNNSYIFFLGWWWHWCCIWSWISTFPRR